VTVRASDTVPLAGPEPQTLWAVRVAPGLLLALLVAAVATVLVGGPGFGIVASKPVLQLSIVVLGTGLSLQ
jgi:hypothetical protein